MRLKHIFIYWLLTPFESCGLSLTLYYFIVVNFMTSVQRLTAVVSKCALEVYYS